MEVAVADGELVAVILAVGVTELDDVALAVTEAVLVTDDESVALFVPVIVEVGVCDRVIVGVDVVVGSAMHQLQLATASALAMVPLLEAETEMVRRWVPLMGTGYNMLNQESLCPRAVTCVML